MQPRVGSDKEFNISNQVCVCVCLCACVCVCVKEIEEHLRRQ
jgi:hypothetical protein